MEKVANILVVEDDQLDVIDIRRSMDKLKLIYQLEVAKNGKDAMDLLTAKAASANAQLPDIILVDINMPKMNGLEFLTALRANEQLKHLKCFVITTSGEKVDREKAEKLGISGYLIKPIKLASPNSMDTFNLMIDLMNLKSSS
jgi:CheY-like chemotaxis protein